MPQLSMGQFGALHAQLGTDGGFTVNPSTGKAVTNGISVAPHGNELRIPSETSSPADLAAFHGDPGNQARFERGASFGGWREEDKPHDDYIDTPTVYPDTPAGKSRARNQMVKSDQIAAYNIGPGHTLLNPFHPRNKGLDISTSDDSPETQAAWVAMPRRVTKGKKLDPMPQSFS